MHRSPFTDLLDSLSQNGKPPDENGSAVNGDGDCVRHRRDKAHGADPSHEHTDSAKSYSAEQLEAVRKSVHFIFCPSGSD